MKILLLIPIFFIVSDMGVGAHEPLGQISGGGASIKDWDGMVATSHMP
jgi:hypothetical protein